MNEASNPDRCASMKQGKLKHWKPIRLDQSKEEQNRILKPIFDSVFRRIARKAFSKK